ncbi:NAD(P)/FAD-dependent oxidoreductase [Polaromonas sp.]|jgi:NADPH-dependent 2,4-dienoyl-CoA reductase/sulfur reductase-like enzyme|uniref:NAD(P)/FAD-dependent oxidoreductase n=1 Tax=Polaromonas sp. TaxID=1869339 RepID=UPI000BC56E12|nr:NAD(P)/FAD-dependent oxidoreductase [Polaromonas sp.]OYY96590.1 MAG: flavocytochrome C [Polaromonas sp. 28-63-22]HQS31722.1 NAD(P)/FAD-dependent oxidoreductase [Polaromonas sp.]HQS90956.1 NAD(P)/FAD-dependent oxidoreductase [Polaromonas sp.]
MKRRHFVQASLALGAVGSFTGCASTSGGLPSKAKVVVVGGGYGGATAAKYVRMLSDYTIDVLLIEPNAAFVSCPMSNLVIGGTKLISDITSSYDKLGARHGVKVVRDRVVSIDIGNKTVTLASGPSIGYNKLVLSPGIDMMWDTVEGSEAANTSGHILQAWKAGPETVALRKQLEAMPDGGVYAITIPEAPYRCPPGPYERASQVASYFKKAKPRSKVLILDANQDVISKGPLFKKYWADNYAGMLEYRPQHKATGVDARTRTVRFDVHSDVKADVLNVLPGMRAGAIAVKSGLANANARWCHVNYQTFESTAARDVHVIGDAIQVAPLMPKSGHMANAQGKVVAAAVVAQLSGFAIDPQPVLTNTCYSFVSDKLVVHVASVHQYMAAEKTYKTVAGSGGVSTAPNELEGAYALSWAQNIWADTLM